MRFFPLILLAALATSGPAAADGPPTSEYTSTASENCRKIGRSKGGEDDGGSSREECRGFGGYTVLVVGDDDRSWIEVKYGDTISDLYEGMMEAAPGNFPNKANDTVEWRGVRRDGAFQPYARISRRSGTTAAGKSRTRLLVVKLNRGRASVIGFAEGAGEDARAKRLADTCRPGE